MDCTCVGKTVGRFVGRANCQVGSPIAIEIARRQGPAKVSAKLGNAVNAWRVLCPKLRAFALQSAAAAAEENVNAAGAARADSHPWRSNGQVRNTIAIEIAN